MEDDIRDLVHGSSPPQPDAKSLKSRSKSTTAKSSKKSKKSSDSKSKSKSTTKAKKKRDKSATRVPDPATLTIQVPPDAVSVPLATTTPTPLPEPLPAPKTSVSEHLREIINDPTIPVATPPTTTTRVDAPIPVVVDDQEKEKASKPRKKKDTKRPSTSSKRKEQQKQKQTQQQQQQQEDEEGEEKRKRRERLMVSPFEYLHITPFRHGEEEFHDDISYLTLPKPLRDQEGKSNGKIMTTEEELYLESHHLSQVDEETATPNGDNTESNDALAPIDKANNVADPPQPSPSPAPGWARKTKPERTANTTEQASTQLSQSSGIWSIPFAHLIALSLRSTHIQL